MDPREALDKTLKYFDLKASEIAKLSNSDPHEISKYRRGHKDMGTVKLFAIVDSLPVPAKVYFYNLCIFGESVSFDRPKSLAKVS